MRWYVHLSRIFLWLSADSSGTWSPEGNLFKALGWCSWLTGASFHRMFRQIFSFPSVRKGSRFLQATGPKRRSSIGASVFGCQGSDCSPSSVSQCACAVAIFAPLGCFSHASLFAVCLPPLVSYDQGTAAAGCSRLLKTHRRSQVLPTGPDYRKSAKATGKRIASSSFSA